MPRSTLEWYCKNCKRRLPGRVRKGWWYGTVWVRRRVCGECGSAFLTYERAGSAQTFHKWRAKAVEPAAPCTACGGTQRVRWSDGSVWGCHKCADDSVKYESAPKPAPE